MTGFDRDPSVVLPTPSEEVFVLSAPRVLIANQQNSYLSDASSTTDQQIHYVWFQQHHHQHFKMFSHLSISYSFWPGFTCFISCGGRIKQTNLGHLISVMLCKIKQLLAPAAGYGALQDLTSLWASLEILLV